MMAAHLHGEAQSDSRISIRMDEGKARFYHTGTGDRFEPRGFNYIQLVQSPNGPYGESALFQPDSHDHIAIDDDFQRMAALGYNVLRVFVDLCRESRCITSETGFVSGYLDNIVHLLRRAQQYGIYVMLTANWLPDGFYSLPPHEICHQSGNFEGGNCLVMSDLGVDQYAAFFRDLILELQQRNAPMEQIWVYELRNEFFVEHNFPPFTKNTGIITTANGMSYDMSSASDRTKMGEDAVVFWANTIRNAIKEVDPEALVTCGFFTPNEPNVLRENDARIVPFIAALQRSDLDFFGIHSYAGFEEFHLEAENYGIIDYIAKPIVLGEYGAFLPNAPDEYNAAQLVDHWMADACMYGVEGYTFWTWDRHRVDVSNPDDPWAGSDEGAFIAQAISPYNKISPCDILLPPTNVALGKRTNASMEWEGHPSENAVDGRATDTPWISGGDPPQWVAVDLGQIYDLASIQIVVETGSNEPHFYTHRIQTKTFSNQPYETIHEFADDRVNYEVLTYSENSLIENVRYIRIFIPQAPGWAALHELRAFIPQEREQFDVPPPPILTYPRPGIDNFEGTELRWKNDFSGLAADVQISTTPEFSAVIDEAGNITTGKYEIGHINFSDILYWRVKQKNEFGESFWSVTGSIERMTTSVSDLSFEEFHIYPNPVRNFLHLNLEAELSGNYTAKIYSCQGNLLNQHFIASQIAQLDITGLNSGLYFLIIEDFKRIKTFKFIKL